MAGSSSKLRGSTRSWSIHPAVVLFFAVAVSLAAATVDELASCTLENTAPFVVEVLQLTPHRQSHGELATGERISIQSCVAASVFGAFRRQQMMGNCAAGSSDAAEACTTSQEQDVELPLVKSLGPYHAPASGEVLHLGQEYQPQDGVASFGPSERLAQLLNFEGAPSLRTLEWMSAAALHEALGTLRFRRDRNSGGGAATGRTRGEKLGWGHREGSFLELLRFTQPLTVPEFGPELDLEETFSAPVIVKRAEGGCARIASKRPKKQKQALAPAHKERLGSLQIRMLVTFAVQDAVRWPSHMQARELTFGEFFQLSDGRIGRKQVFGNFTLATPASSLTNVEVQTTARTLEDVGGFADVQKNMYGSMHRGLRGKNFFTEPSAARLGVAGSLRGLMFHRHQAALNEPLVGRKLFGLFPPRQDMGTLHPTSGLMSVSCPWPPWDPRFPTDDQRLAQAHEDLAPGGNAERLTEELLQGTDMSKEMRSCSAPITALQWLVFEMPKLEAKHRPMLFLVREGEALWIPDSWEHLTINIDESLWAYMSSSDDMPDNLPKLEEARTIAQDLCNRTGRFCEGYCGHWCTRCRDRDCGC